MKVFYRISDNSYKKPKLEGATKKRCLLNFIDQWQNSKEIIIFADKCNVDTLNYLHYISDTTGIPVNVIEGGSSAGSWRIVRDEALKLSDDEVVYFVEDDYWHLAGSRIAVVEGIQRADYVSLYDAPDKYVPASNGGNPLIPDDGGEHTIVIRTLSSHWKLTNSTTMTFAVKVGTLREDYQIWKNFTSGNHPHDFEAFLALREIGRSLITPLPSFSTHCEPAWLAPGIDWNSTIESYFYKI